MSIIDFEKRPVVDLSALCVPIPEYPKELCLTLPGGLQFCSTTGHLQLGSFEYARAAMAQMNPALAPLGPIFKVIDAILSVEKCLSTIPDILGPPPNPKKLKDALEDLAEKMVLVAKLMPIFSVPLMVLQMIDVFIATLDSAGQELTSLAKYIQRIQQAELVVNQSQGLAQIIKCAVSSKDAQISNLEHMFGAINPTIDMINLFAALAQLRDGFPIPRFEGVMPPEPLLLGALLQDMATKMRVIRSAIPI